MNVNQNTNTSRNQNTAILATLKRGERLTSLEALDRFGCFRLPARIYDLRGQGYDIEDRTVATQSGKRVKEYWLKREGSA